MFHAKSLKAKPLDFPCYLFDFNFLTWWMSEYYHQVWDCWSGKNNGNTEDGGQ